MKKYTRPEVQAYQVNPSEVICGSGGTNASISNGDGTPTIGPGGISGNSADRRSDWDCYEGRW